MIDNVDIGNVQSINVYPMYRPSVDTSRKIATTGAAITMISTCNKINRKIHQLSVYLSSTSLVFQAIAPVMMVGIIINMISGARKAA